MHYLHFTAETSSAGILERDFTAGDVPGVLWSAAAGPDRAPLVLMGHGGGLHKKTPALASRARDLVTAHGFTVAAIDAPGHGERPRTEQDDRSRDGMRAAVASGDHEKFRSISIDYTLSLTEQAITEWQATLDALQQLPEIGDAPVGYGGGISMGTAIGIPLTAVDSRIRAAIFGGGFFVYDELLDAARQVSVPVQFLLPWDDEFVDRHSSLQLFDAFASPEKTLHANPGDHRRIRWIGVDQEFLPRHLDRGA
ncbi:MAG TPA: alpha/beta hydrolase [Mycobacteriales bacterium]|nr:alpha/beta hydrolase [Mycobacteriales bacterium]